MIGCVNSPLPPRPEGARRRDSRNLAFTSYFMSVYVAVVFRSSGSLNQPISYTAGTDPRGRAHRGRLRKRRLLAGGALDLHEGVSRRLVSRSARSQFGKVGKRFCVIIALKVEFPIPSLVRFRHVLFWEFPCPAWAVASYRSGTQAGETPQD